MPYLILMIGVLIGLYALYQFFLNADTRQVRAFGTTSAFVVLCLALFFMAVTRRLPLALVLLIVTFPFIWKFIKSRLSPPEPGPMRGPDGLEILDLKAEPEEDEGKNPE